jgi:hypothetical protein
LCFPAIKKPTLHQITGGAFFISGKMEQLYTAKSFNKRKKNKPINDPVGSACTWPPWPALSKFVQDLPQKR